MRPPARRMSAAWRIRRTCGSMGCSCRYSAKSVLLQKKHPAWNLRAARDNIRGPLPGTRRSFRTVAPQLPPMQTLTGLAPLVAFFVTYRWGGLYAATAVLMVTMVLVLGIDWLRERRIPPVHALSAVLVLVFGGATLLLHNRAFIQWKPTVLLWVVGLAFLGSFWVGTRTLTE